MDNDKLLQIYTSSFSEQMIEQFVKAFDKAFALLANLDNVDVMAKITQYCFNGQFSLDNFLELCCCITLKPSYYLIGLSSQIDSLIGLVESLIGNIKLVI